MTRRMMATASAVLQLRTQFLQVLSRPVKTLNNTTSLLNELDGHRTRHRWGGRIRIRFCVDGAKICTSGSRAVDAMLDTQPRRSQTPTPKCIAYNVCSLQLSMYLCGYRATY